MIYITEMYVCARLFATYITLSCKATSFATTMTNFYQVIHMCSLMNITFVVNSHSEVARDARDLLQFWFYIFATFKTR